MSCHYTSSSFENSFEDTSKVHENVGSSPNSSMEVQSSNISGETYEPNMPDLRKPETQIEPTVKKNVSHGLDNQADNNEYATSMLRVIFLTSKQFLDFFYSLKRKNPRWYCLWNGRYHLRFSHHRDLHSCLPLLEKMQGTSWKL